jgi:hypothetical protein
MAYNPLTDFSALLRQTSGGQRFARTPTLDVVLLAMSRAGLFNMEIGATAPILDQAKTAWFKPADPSYAAEGTLYLWNAGDAEYQPATSALFLALLQAG